MKPAVLYVEDDADNRSIMQILLVNQLGLERVAIWEDSANFEARLAGLTFTPDIILLDIHIEPLDGFGMLKVLRTHPQFQALPIAAVTASVMNEEIKQLKGAGFNGVITKPIDIDRFPWSLKRLLNGEELWY